VYAASGFALTASVSGKAGDQSSIADDEDASDKSKAAAAGKTAPSAGAGIGSASGSQSSTTASAISGGTLTITDAARQAQTGQDATGISRDVTTENSAQKAGALTQAWNGQQLMAQVQAQTAIVQAFTTQAPKAIADFADRQIKDLKDQLKTESDPDKQQALKTEIAKWDEGGIYRVALHTASGALSGGVGGALGAATIASSANLMDDFQNTTQQTLEQQGMSTEAARVAAQGIAEAASLGIGALVGGTAGAATSLTVDTNNRQLHPSEAKFIESNAEKYAAQRGILNRPGIPRHLQASCGLLQQH